MTLILTAGCSDFIVQVSDRRFCLAESTKHGVRLVDIKTDEGNKELVVVSYATHFSVAFTGLAEVGGQSVGDWLAEVIVESKAAAQGISECAQALRDAATRSFGAASSLGSTDFLEFVFSGYDARDKGPRVILVSNFRTETHAIRPVPTRRFAILRPRNVE
ncbi:MAG: hypothetical protein WBD55_10735, partial [Dehalococcoidia bacterium]